MSARWSWPLPIIVCFSGHANAAEYYGEFGGWTVFKDSEACGISMEYEGPGETALTLVRYPEGRVGVLISNYNWSAQENSKYDVHYSLNGTAYSGIASGSKTGIRRGFTAFFGEEFVADFSKGETLYVYLGDKQIDELSLSGTAGAMRKVETCLAIVRKELAAAERERARYAHLPKDPFASADATKTVEGPRDPLPVN